MTPSALFETGKLKEAIAALVEDLKKSPLDRSKRGFLCELLCFTGEFERADSHLDAIVKQDSKAAVSVALFRQLIRAEQARRQLFTEGRLPEYLDKPSERLQLHLRAIVALRENDSAQAAEYLQQAENLTPEIKGKSQETPFVGFRDLDDLTATFFETFTSTGKYYWIPIEQVEWIEFRPIESPRDLLWRRVEMKVADGPEGEVFLPAIYAGTESEQDQALWLGRQTDWRENAAGFTRGVGQKIFLLGDDDVPIRQLQKLEFDPSNRTAN